MYCICCKQDKVTPDSKYLNGDKSEEELLWEKTEKEMSDGTKHFRTINNQMVNGGIIHIIDAGYGSTHDGDRIIIAICDECLNQNLEDATLLYFGNCIDEVEKSKKKYRRRKNLDTLTNK